MKKTSILLMALLLSPQLQAQGVYGGVEGGNGGNYTLHASCHSYRDCYQSVERILLLKQSPISDFELSSFERYFKIFLYFRFLNSGL